MQDWLPGAEVIGGPHQDGGSMVGGPYKMTHHITTGGSFDFLKGYLVEKGYEPTLLIDPIYGRIGQFLPASRSAYALEHNGAPETNRMGVVNIQIEWCWNTMDDPTITNAPKFWDVWKAALSFARANKVPDYLPFTSFYSTSRDSGLWQQSGHAGHRNAPNQFQGHTDSLPVRDTDLSRLFATSVTQEDDDMPGMAQWWHDTDTGTEWSVTGTAKRRITSPSERAAWQNAGLLSKTINYTDTQAEKDILKLLRED